MIQTVRSKIEPGVARITLAAAESGNALNAGSLQALRQALAKAEGEESCRVIVLSAEGADFSSGLDVASALAEPAARDPRIFQDFIDCLMTIRRSSRPVIACVSGNVKGGGVGLAAACDLVIAGETATFMLPEVVLGMIPALIAPFLLARLTLAQIRSMALSSRSFNAQEANVLGLVDEVAPGGPEGAVERQIRRILRSSPRALARCKRYFERLDSQDLNRQAAMAAAELESWVESPGVMDGLRAFAEGFSPPWFMKTGQQAGAGGDDVRSSNSPSPVSEELPWRE